LDCVNVTDCPLSTGAICLSAMAWVMAESCTQRGVCAGGDETPTKNTGLLAELVIPYGPEFSTMGVSVPCRGPGWSVGLESLAMAKSKKKAESVFLVCKETGDYNYVLRKKPGGEKLSLKKFCPRLRKHTEHAEKKK